MKPIVNGVGGGGKAQDGMKCMDRIQSVFIPNVLRHRLADVYR